MSRAVAGLDSVYDSVYVYSAFPDYRLYNINLASGSSFGYVVYSSAPAVGDVIGDSDNGGVSTTALMIAPLERYQLPMLYGNPGIHTGGSVAGDLAITGSEQPSAVGVGIPVTCTFIVTNRGPHAVSPVYAGDVLPPGLSIVSAVSSRGTCLLTTNKFAADLGLLPPGGFATISLVLTSSAVGLLEHRAAVGGYVVDSASSNNSVIFSLLVNNPPMVANLIPDLETRHKRNDHERFDHLRHSDADSSNTHQLLSPASAVNHLSQHQLTAARKFIWTKQAPGVA